MRNTLRALLLLSLLMLLPSCGVLSSLGKAASDSSALQERSDALDKKLDQVQATFDAYGPLAESLGPDIKEGYEKLQAEYGKVRGQVDEGVALVKEAQSLHSQSMEKATDKDTGETDWIQYMLLMLAGGGGVYETHRRNKKGQKAERTQTETERNALHARIDDKSSKVKGLQEQMVQLQHRMELEAARREGKAS